METDAKGQIINFEYDDTRRLKKVNPPGIAEDVTLADDFLLRRGYDGGTARFSEDGTGFSLQFRKYINPNAAIGLEMQFPANHGRSHITPMSKRC